MSDIRRRRVARFLPYLPCNGVSVAHITRCPVAKSLCLALTLLALASSPVSSHLTRYTGAERSSTVAEIWIDADRIVLKLEVGDLDREAFNTLLTTGPVNLDESELGLALTAG